MARSEIESNSYYQPGAERANRVRLLFDRIAHRYDLINDLQSFGLHRAWKKRLIADAGVRPGMRALDVCCGTGDLSFALAREGADTTGLDFSHPMLAEAVSKRDHPKWNKLPRPPAFIHGDAMQLPFENDRFDVVTMAYGLRNLSDWKTGLTELHRVTKPGGRILILDFGKPPNPVWRSVYFQYLAMAVPVMGWALAGDAEAYRYILTSLRHFPAQRGIEAELIRLRSHHIRTHLFLGGVMSLNTAFKG